MASYEQFINYLFSKSRQPGVPLSGTFELTSRCNLDCRMCYIHKRANDSEAIRQELSAQEWLSIAREAQSHGMLLLLLTGGEPLIRPDFPEIYKGCSEMGLLINVNTNGTLITEKIVELFKAYPPMRLNITVYGASEETYRGLCGDPDAFHRVFRALKMLKEAGIRVKLNFSITPCNRADLAAIRDFADKNGYPLQIADYMFPPIRANENSPCSAERLTASEAARARWEYEVKRFPEEHMMKRVRNLLGGIRVGDSECQELPTERIRCRAGATTFWMTCAGQMRPCGMMTVPTVDARQIGFDNAWAHTRQEREKIMLPAKCTACKYKENCEFCPAACYAETGSFTGVPEYLCEKTETYLDFARAWLAEKGEQE